jgi:hypothetical protein
MNNYLAKPVKPNTLKALLESYLPQNNAPGPHIEITKPPSRTSAGTLDGVNGEKPDSTKEELPNKEPSKGAQDNGEWKENGSGERETRDSSRPRSRRMNTS